LEYQVGPEIVFVTGPNVNTNDATADTSLRLLVRAKAQDPAAWQRLVSLYGPLVERWCRQANLQDADGADVRQEIFLAVHRNIGQFRLEKTGDTFRGWLMGEMSWMWEERSTCRREDAMVVGYARRM